MEAGRRLSECRIEAGRRRGGSRGGTGGRQGAMVGVQGGAKVETVFLLRPLFYLKHFKTSIVFRAFAKRSVPR